MLEYKSWADEVQKVEDNIMQKKLIFLWTVISVVIALLTDIENQEVFQQIVQGLGILNCILDLKSAQFI